MCMYARTERAVSQRAVRNSRVRPAQDVPCSERRKRCSNAVASEGNDPFAFLNVRLGERAVTEDILPSCYLLNISSSYERLCKVAAQFLDYFKVPFDFVPDGNVSAIRLESLIAWFEKKVEEQGFYVATVKHDPFDETCADIDFVVYNPICELELTVTTFIVSPMEQLPKKAAYLYARFIKFVSESMSVTVGVEHTDNYYLTMAYDSHEVPEDDLDETDEAQMAHAKKCKEVVNNYKKGGKWCKLFDEIDKVVPGRLDEDIRKYIEECDDHDVKRLFEVLLKGLPIVGKMNVHWFDFNPDKDGINDDQDSYIDVFAQQMILYSFNDGINKSVLNMLTSDYNCGVIPVGYNMRLWLHDSISRENIAEFVDNRDLGHRFADWNTDYYQSVVKFDMIQEEKEDGEI